MLILTRKKDDRIMIGDNIEIVVVAVEGDRVKIGINAPKGMPVHRGEIYKAIQSENQAALSSVNQGELLRQLGQIKEKNNE